jgi:hypothetical protein
VENNARSNATNSSIVENEGTFSQRNVIENNNNTIDLSIAINNNSDTNLIRSSVRPNNISNNANNNNNNNNNIDVNGNNRVNHNSTINATRYAESPTSEYRRLRRRNFLGRQYNHNLLFSMFNNNNQNNSNGAENINPNFLMQLAQMQNNLPKSGGLNLVINKQNNNNVNDINNQKIMNNSVNTANNNINLINNPLINNNMQILSQMNPQLLQNQLKNMTLMPNINNAHPDMNMINNKNQASQQNNFNNQNNANNNNNNNNNNNYNDEKNFGKYTCKYEILIANDRDFQIARRLIGSKGYNMKNIINQCKSKPDDSDNVKLRLRGKGSGYKEGPDYKESDEPLHLCISSKNPEDMKKACLLVDELLNKIHIEYKEYCEKYNLTPENTEIAMRIESKNLGYNGK